MQKAKITIGICSIGSGVGQSVIESCRLSPLPLRTIGLGNRPLTFGHLDCDESAQIPSYYADDYIESLLNLARSKHIDLLIPGHDDEALILAEHAPKFAAAGIQILSSSKQFHQICRDKSTIRASINPECETILACYTADEFRENHHNIKFAFPSISKPLNGFASKDVTLIHSSDDLSKIKDNDVVQPLIRPHLNDPERSEFDAAVKRGKVLQVAEISIQLVLSKFGTLLGKMATRNRLQRGAPIEIIAYENDEMWKSVDHLLPHLVKAGAAGPVNLQGRLTDHGLRIFEINPRFTGITGVRAKLGFNEVDACIRQWLGLGLDQKLHVNPKRIALRHHQSRIISEDQLDRTSHPFLKTSARSKDMRPVMLITGSTGEIGKRLLRKLYEIEQFKFITLDRSKHKARKEFKLLGPIQHFDWSDFEAGSIGFASVDRILHLASARPHQGDEELALSLQRSCDLFSAAATFHVPAIVNISSQSVYTNQLGHLLDEMEPPRPSTPYGMMKFAIEMHLEAMRKLHPELKTTSIRLETITGHRSDSYAMEFVSRMVNHCINERTITIYGNESIHARIDICDAVDGICALVQSDSNTWRSAYNLGSGNQFRLLELVEIISLEVLRVLPCRAITINQEPAQNTQRFGLNCEKFQSDFKWQPNVTLRQSIRRLIHQTLSEQKTFDGKQ